MKVAVISPEFPPLTNWGGVATFSKNLSLLLKKNNHEVEVFTYNPNLSFTKVEDGIKIHYIPHKTNSKLFNFFYFKFPFNLIKKSLKKVFPTTFFTLEWNIFLSFYLKEQTKKFGEFKVIHAPTYYWSGLFLKLFNKNIKIVSHVQGTQFINKKFEKQTLDSKLKDTIEKLFINHLSDKIVCCSQHIFREMIENFSQIKAKTVYIQNFSLVEKQIQTKTNFNNLIFLGRLEPRKGVDVLLETFIKLAKTQKKLKLFLIGENGWGFKIGENFVDFYTYMETIKIDSDIKKRIKLFPNIIDRSTLLDFISTNKGIAILPSRNEAFGFVIAEAMSLGLITVTGNNEGGSEIIENGISGFNTKVELKSLTKTINQILKMDLKQKKQIEKNARQRIKKLYDLNSVTNKYIKMYQDLN